MILGFDLSQNHAGVVNLDEDGELAGYWFTSDKVGAVKEGAPHGRRTPPKPREMSREQHQLNRLNAYSQWFWDIICESGAEYAGIEGYAFKAKSNSAYQYGELGGLARREFTNAGLKVRIHDPQSVKMWATGKGNANSADLLYFAPEDLREKWLRIERNLKENQVAEDLAVAYWIAKLVYTEIELRAGRVQLSDFEEKRVRVFTRITKTYPINLLARDWLVRQR